MNALGLDRRSCACTLQGYWRAIRRVAALSHDEARATQARTALDRLLFDLEVDVGARRGEIGRARMTPIEAAVLHPALAGAWRCLDAIAYGDPPASWQTALRSALGAIRDALPALRHWDHGPASAPNAASRAGT